MPAKSKDRNYDFLPAYVLKGYMVNGLILCGDTGHPILWGFGGVWGARTPRPITSDH